MVSIVAKDSGGGDFTPCPAGTHFAICNMVIDLGWQVNNFEGKETTQRKVFLRWEIPDELMESGQPFTIGRQYTLSLSSKSTLRKVLEAWRGKAFTKEELAGFDIVNLAGKCCQLQVIHTEGDKVYANVSAVMGLGKGDKERAKDIKPANPVVVYSALEHDKRVYEDLPEWLRKKLDNAVAEPNKGKAPAAATPVDDSFDDDSIPF